MPQLVDPRGEDNPSTYFVEDRNNEAEMIRLLFLEALTTAGMGGPLAEQPDPASLRRVLDIGCGPGGWVLQSAVRYPNVSLVGIDISWRMIEYAQAQAQAQKLTDRVEFRVMDALRPLEFPDDSFDLVNLRFGSSYLRVQDWPRLLSGLLRVICPGGTIRVTDGPVPRGNSPVYQRLRQMIFCASYQAGHYVSEHMDISHELARLLSESGYQQVQTRPHQVELIAGTVGGQQIRDVLIYGYQTGKPFLQKWGCAAPDYDALCEQALVEMQEPDFRATLELITAWGTKPRNEQEGNHDNV